MCLGIPAKIISINKDTYMAEVDYMGNVKTVSTMLAPGVDIGSWVMVHAGQIISVMSEEEAQESLQIWEELINDLPDSF